MILRIEKIKLQGTKREISFDSGLNIVVGSIATGKTTLLRLIKAVLGGSLEDLPPETKKISSLESIISVNNNLFTIVRPFVSTSTALIDVAGEKDFLRLPFSKRTEQKTKTYLNWLLDKLELPALEVPASLTKIESEPTPVTINDYLFYCVLTQEGIGTNVFEHNHPFKDIKRRYVFEILYGIYDIEMARLQEELRNVKSKIRVLSNETEFFNNFLSNTELENRAKIIKDYHDISQGIQDLERQSIEFSKKIEKDSETEDLNKKLFSLQEQARKVNIELVREDESINGLTLLSSQLQSQSEKIAKSITSKKHLSEIDFVVCPRCGNQLDQSRVDDSQCYLCLQPSRSETTREELVREQQRIESEISEISDLIESRKKRIEFLRKQISEIKQEEKKIQEELDFKSSASISSQIDTVSKLAEERATLKERKLKLESFLNIFNKFDKSIQELTIHKTRELELENQLELQKIKYSDSKEKTKALIRKYNAILESLNPPDFGEDKDSTIDMKKYLPTFHGREFDKLSSPGLCTLVNVAYAFSHQETAIDFNLKLPSLLIIDGLSEHIGEFGLDPERLNSIYKYIIDFCNKNKSKIQVIIFDNYIPSFAKEFIKLNLTEDERLII